MWIIIERRLKIMFTYIDNLKTMPTYIYNLNFKVPLTIEIEIWWAAYFIIFEKIIFDKFCKNMLIL